MKKRSGIILGSIVAFLVLSIWCTVIFVIVGKQNVTSSGADTYISCSWEYAYSDVEELAAQSDVIAIVTVKELARTKGGLVPASYFDVRVMSAIYGCEEGDILQIYMTGGVDKEGDMVMVDVDPLMEEGQQFLVFADKNETGTYSILGGPQGRMEYKNGFLNTLNHTSLLEPARDYKARMFDDSNIAIQIPGSVDVKNQTIEELMPYINSGLSQKREVY